MVPAVPLIVPVVAGVPAPLAAPPVTVLPAALPPVAAPPAVPVAVPPAVCATVNVEISPNAAVSKNVRIFETPLITFECHASELRRSIPCWSGGSYLFDDRK